MEMITINTLALIAFFAHQRTLGNTLKKEKS